MCGAQLLRLSCPVQHKTHRISDTVRCGQTSSDVKTTGKHRRKRTPRAVVLRRGHFKRLDEVKRPPWPVLIRAEVHELGMEEHFELNPERKRDRSDGGASFDETNEIEDGVTLDATVRPIGTGGFFVEGDVTCKAQVGCDRCGTFYGQTVTTAINAWLDENAVDDDTSGDWDVVPFPKNVDDCDLTPLIRDLLRMNAPYEKLCDCCVGVQKDNGDDSFVFSLEPED